MIRRIICIISLVLFFCFAGLEREAFAADLANGAAIFEANCVGCHLNGSNIIRRGKNLQLKALTRNKMDSIDAISNLVIKGKGAMSAFGDRLTQEEIANVSAYVLDRANNNWQAKQ